MPYPCAGIDPLAFHGIDYAALIGKRAVTPAVTRRASDADVPIVRERANDGFVIKAGGADCRPEQWTIRTETSMRLFLTSYLAGTRGLADEFLSKAGPREIVFVPTAANVEEYRGYVDEGMAALREMGYGLRILDVSEAPRDEAEQAVLECDCLCVSGGNTFFLLQELRRKGLVGLIAERARKGMPYIGESAGAVIASPDIGYCRIMDDEAAAPGLDDCSGMGLVDWYVLPHNGEFPFVEATAEMIRIYGGELDLVPLDNSQAAVVNSGGFSVMAEEPRDGAGDGYS